MKQLAVAAFMAITGLGIVQAASDPASERKLQQAIDLIESKGDPAKAAPLLEDVARSSDRALAARALLYIAQLEERRDKARARDVYARLVQSFPGERDVVNESRLRLARLAPRQSPAPRRVLDVDTLVPTGISGDGRLLIGSFVSLDTGAVDLAIRDMSTSETTRLVPGSPGVRIGQALHPAILSANGRQAAFTRFESPAAGSAYEARDVCIVAVETGATPRVVLAAQPSRSVVPVDWAPDGRSLLVAVFPTANPVLRQGFALAWLSTTEATVRTIRQMDPLHRLISARVSPDGRHIVYVTGELGGTPDTRVWLTPADGRAEVEVVRSAGQHAEPVWAPDSSRIFYVSDRSSDQPSLWSVAVVNGAPAGEPSVLRTNFQGRLLGVSASGAVHYAQESMAGGPFILIADRSQTSSPTAEIIPGTNPRWSPDGTSLAFFRRVDAVPRLIVRSATTGQETRYGPGGSGFAPQIAGMPQWRADGSGLLVLLEQRRLSFLNLPNGIFTSASDSAAVGQLNLAGSALSHDGKTLYLVQGGSLRSVDLATGTIRPLSSVPGAGGVSGATLALSPDGGTLAAVVWGQSRQQSRLVTVHTDGTGYREVFGPFPTGEGRLLSWDSDTKSIVFAAFEPNGSWRLMRVPAAGGEAIPDGLSSRTFGGSPSIHRVSPGTLSGFHLSPDNKRFAVAISTLATNEVWVLENPLTGGSRQTR